MAASKRKRLHVIVAGLVLALALYFVAYFLCVSVQFVPETKDPTDKSIETAEPWYEVSSPLEEFAYWFFVPAQGFDAYYFRPNLWKDRQNPVRPKTN